MRTLISLLKATFSEEGSNKRRFENQIYAEFLKYLRQVSSKYKIVYLLGIAKGILLCIRGSGDLRYAINVNNSQYNSEVTGHKM